MSGKLAGWLVLGALVVFSIPGSSAAGCNGDWPYLPAVGCWYAPGAYVRDYIPYFALYPPVYYSHPVPRPYGYSPYAYLPGTRTPEGETRNPLVIRNTYVVGRAEPESGDQGTKPAPLRITNPYVRP